jgi:hypothetical protein
MHAGKVEPGDAISCGSCLGWTKGTDLALNAVQKAVRLFLSTQRPTRASECKLGYALTLFAAFMTNRVGAIQSSTQLWGAGEDLLSCQQSRRWLRRAVGFSYGGLMRLAWEQCARRVRNDDLSSTISRDWTLEGRRDLCSPPSASSTWLGSRPSWHDMSVDSSLFILVG